MTSEGLNMSNIPGFCNDDNPHTGGTLGDDVKPAPIENTSSDNYERVLTNQAEIEISIMDLTKMVSGMRSTQQSMLTAISNLGQDVKEMRDANNNMHASNMNNGTFEVELEGSAQNTRQMSSAVPAALVRGVWYDVHPNTPFPVSFKYMKSICDSVMDQFPDNIKRAMGATLSKYIKDIDNNVAVHTPILITLCRQHDREAAETRNLYLKLIKTLGTHLAFLLPFELNSVLNRITVINNSKFVLNTEHNPSNMVKPKDGFDRFSATYLDNTKVAKALKSMRASGFTRSNSTGLYHAISTGRIDADGKLDPTPIKEGVAMESLSPVVPSLGKKLVFDDVVAVDVDDIFSPMKPSAAIP